MIIVVRPVKVIDVFYITLAPQAWGWAWRCWEHVVLTLRRKMSFSFRKI